MPRTTMVVPLLAFAACTPAEPPGGGAQGDRSFRVTLVEDYYWPSAVETPAGQQIEAFPLVTALVVEKPDGRPLTAEDEVASREAVLAFCTLTGQDHAPDASARLSDGAWAFSPCEPVSP